MTFVALLSALALVSLSQYTFKAVFLSFVALLCPLVTFYFVRNFDSFKLAKSIFVFQHFFLVVAVVQQYVPFGPSSLLLGWLKVLIPRMTLSPLSDFDRGISIVASEPSTMAPLIFMMIAIGYFLYKNKKITRQHFLISLFISMYLGVLTQSLTFYVTIVYVLVATVSFYLIRLSSKVFLVSGIGFLSLVVVYMSGLLPTRLFAFLSSFSFDVDTLVAVNELSGSRLGITFGPYCNAISFGDYFYGLGAWSQNFALASSCLPIDLSETSYFETHELVNVKPSSLPSLLLVDIGQLGFSLHIILLYFLLKYYMALRSGTDGISFGIVGASIVSIIIGGFPLTLPHFWLVLALFLKSESIIGNKKYVR
jgi:hypothetical protein